MKKDVSRAMDYEPTPVDGEKKVSVKKQLKMGRKERRDSRKVGDMTFWQLQWYAMFWKGFVPHNAQIAWVLVGGMAVLFIVVK